MSGTEHFASSSGFKGIQYLLSSDGVRVHQWLTCNRVKFMFPFLLRFTDFGLLLLRLMVGLIFVTSGYSHVKNPAERAKSIGMSKGFTIFLGIAEIAGGLGVAAGVLTQLAAIGLILVMLGAIQKQIFVWHTKFWGGKSGWHYDLMLVLMNLVIAFTDGGRYVLTK